MIIYVIVCPSNGWAETNNHSMIDGKVNYNGSTPYLGVKWRENA
jgi:hypothetical protein